MGFNLKLKKVPLVGHFRKKMPLANELERN